MSENLTSFTLNFKQYFYVSTFLGFLLCIIGTFLPSDRSFIIGMFGLIIAIGFGIMDFLEKRRLKRLKNFV